MAISKLGGSWKKGHILVILLICASVYTIFVVSCVPVWSTTTLNDELQVVLPSPYMDEDTNMSVTAAERNFNDYYNLVEDKNQSITDSQFLIRILLDVHMVFLSNLNMC